MGKAGQFLIALLPLGIALGFAAWSKHDKREKADYNRNQSVLNAQADAARAQAEAAQAKAEAEKMKADFEKEKALWQRNHQDTLHLSGK